MTDTPVRPGPLADLGTPEDEAPAGESRGKFEIFAAPEFPPVPTVDDLAGVPMDGAEAVFDYSGMVEDGADEEALVGAVREMLRAIAPGSRTTTLFAQRGPSGMSLMHVWFGADFPLFRHSHPAYGDCLYYVISGSVILGAQTLGAGSGFFVPNGMPYRYKAGPEGVELLEFRAGGGVEGGAGMTLDEPNVDAVERLTEQAKAAQPRWKVPAQFSSLD